MKRIFVSIIFVFVFLSVKAQVGIGTTTPHASAILELKDSTKGLLLPRLTMAQRLAIQNPAEGLLIYQKDSTKGYWHFDGTQWKNIYSSSTTTSVGGKNKLVLVDSITNAQAQAIIAADFGPNTQEIYIVGCPLLTTLNLSMLTSTTNIFITDNPSLTSINLSGLKTCAGAFYVENCISLTSLDLSSLQNYFWPSFASDYGFVINKTKILALNLPVLKHFIGSMLITANFQMGSMSMPLLANTSYFAVNISSNSLLTNIAMPLLTKCDWLYMENNPLLPVLSLPSLNSVGYFFIDKHNSLTSISFPILTRVTTIPTVSGSSVTSTIHNCINLNNIELGNLVQFSNTGFDIRDLRLSSGVINYLLNKFVSITPLSGKYLELRQYIAAPPTGQGLIDKATLIANGNTVSTN